MIGILKLYHPERIILFGSAANGKVHPDSDIDICVIKKFKNSKLDEKRKLFSLLWRHKFNYLFDPDIQLYNPSKFDKEFKRLKAACEILTLYYTEARYPEDVDTSAFNTKPKAKQAIHLAKKILDFIDKNIRY